MSGSPTQEPRVVSVGGAFRHDVLVGEGLLASAAERIRAAGAAPGTRALLVVDGNAARHGDAVGASLRAAGHPTSAVVLEATEARKSTQALEAVWSAALAARLTRRDLIVAVGGGLVGDVAGFAAATYLRGVRWVAVPTTLLAMVDASTGGKTGVNLPLPTGGLGKNLAGAFWPPLTVLADPTTLRTLPPRELRSGLAECIKHAAIDGADHVAWLAERMPALIASLTPGTAGDLGPVTELVARSVAVKADVVTRDPREEGVRAVLNLGHTFGHAFETDPAVDLTHGEAVAIGLIAAAHAGTVHHGFSEAEASALRALVAAAGLPVALPVTLPAERVEARMGFDKKNEGQGVRFVVPQAFGRVDPKVELPSGVVRAALLAVGCSA